MRRGGQAQALAFLHGGRRVRLEGLQWSASRRRHVHARRRRWHRDRRACGSSTRSTATSCRWNPRPSTSSACSGKACKPAAALALMVALPGTTWTRGRGVEPEPYHRPVTDLEAAWDELHDAKPDGWFVGRRRTTSIAASGSSTPSTRGSARRPGTGRGSGRPSPASELEVVREMARCLRLIGEGKAPD